MSDMDGENIYRAPQSAVTEQPRSHGGYVYRSPRTLAKVVRGMIFGWIATELGLVLASIYQGHVLQQVAEHAFDSPAAINAALTPCIRLTGVFTALSALLLLATFISAGMWIYRVACNARALGARGLEDAPGMAVGWYAIPFMNLARPFRAMAQIWRSSSSPTQWQKKTRTPARLRWWWGLWLSYNIGCYIDSLLQRQAQDIDVVIRQTQMTMATGLLACIAGVVFLCVVMRLSRLQDEQHAQPAAEPSSDHRDGLDLSWLTPAPAAPALPEAQG